MPIADVKRIGRQLFQSLSFIHSHHIVHCDIKPENLLLTPHSNPLSIRVIDFGSSCAIGQRHFDYIQSRFYRAPEVILGFSYGPPIDIWSAACVIAEMMTGRALFCGDCEVAQLQLQMEVLGPPPSAIAIAAPRRALFFHADGSPKRTPIRRSFGRIQDPKLIDLLKQCFEWDQKKRMTAEQVLQHEFFWNWRGKRTTYGSQSKESG
jgi:dual specificity tyrosine-phosphorylation-regulated kinase 2/3/4